MDTWKIIETAFSPATARAYEGLFTLGSGYLHVRGSLEEGLESAPQDVDYTRRPANVTAESFPETAAKWGTYVPGIFEKQLVDQKVNVADEDAFDTARRFAKVEGLLVGMSAGAGVFAALELAKTLERGVIVLILPDFGERYLSTELFTV